jgi:hypothetical protein
LRGNVETEIARNDDVGAGCGCAYPPSVGEDVVRRSNDILRALRDTAQTHAGVGARIARLPMHLVARVSDCRIVIVHGDAWSLAGWRFAQDSLDEPTMRTALARLRERTPIDIFASSHTCLPVLRDIATPAGRVTIVNNGAAGMGNFRQARFGVISRIALSPSPHGRLYGLLHGGLHVDAVAVHFDQQAFLARFLNRWREGSAAHVSYFTRIVSGPDYPLDLAQPAQHAFA